MNELPIRIELEAGRGIDLLDGTGGVQNGPMRDPIVAALAQLVRDAYANEQRLRARSHVVGPADSEPDAWSSEDENHPGVPNELTETKRRKSA